MNKRLSLVVASVIFLYSSFALAKLTCQQVFLSQDPQLASVFFNREMESFEKDLKIYQSIMDVSREIETLKIRTGSLIRKTRANRDKKIHQWRMSVRTGDAYRVVEQIRNLFDLVIGEARILHQSRLLLILLEKQQIKSYFSETEYSLLRTKLIKTMERSIDILGDNYADYSAANWVVQEMILNGELSRILTTQGKPMADFLKDIAKKGYIMPENLEIPFNRYRALNELHEKIIDMLPPNSIYENLMPRLLDRKDNIDYFFVKEVYGGGSSLYRGMKIYKPEGPLLKTLENDLIFERSRAKWHIFNSIYGKLVDMFATTVDFIPGGGFRLKADAFKELPWGDKIITAFSSLSSTTRWALYQFVKAVLNRRAVEEHLSDIETLHKVRESRGDLEFYSTVRDLAARHGELSFYMTYSRIPFYHTDFIAFKSVLKNRIAELEGLGTPSMSLKNSMELVEAAEIRGVQLGTLTVLVNPSHFAESIQSSILFVGTTTTVYELGNFFIATGLGTDPATTSFIHQLFGL
jgi:hypothetical protein